MSKAKLVTYIVVIVSGVAAVVKQSGLLEQIDLCGNVPPPAAAPAPVVRKATTTLLDAGVR